MIIKVYPMFQRCLKILPKPKQIFGHRSPMTTSTDQTIHDGITTFLHKSFLPVRITFPKDALPHYENAIFKWSNIKEIVHINDGTIETPAICMARHFCTDNDIFELQEKDNMYVLDTEGKIPTRYVYMLKDFFFKDAAIIDYNSKVTHCDNLKYWRKLIIDKPTAVLEKIGKERKGM